MSKLKLFSIKFDPGIDPRCDLFVIATSKDLAEGVLKDVLKDEEAFLLTEVKDFPKL